MAARKPFQPKFRFHLNDSHELETVWLNAFEGISMSFRLQLHVVCKEELSFESFLGKKGVLSISSDTHYDDADETRYLNGVVMSAGLIGGGQRFKGSPYYLYELVVAPQMEMLGLKRTSRIFQQKTTRQIVAELLKAAGIEHAFKLQHNHYSARPYCVQYDETDLAFIHRLLAEDGIYYYYRHEKGSHTMVLADTAAGYGKMNGKQDGLRSFAPGTPITQDVKEYISAFYYAESMVSGKATLKDYNFEKPSDNAIKVSVEGQKEKHLEIYKSGPVFDDFEKESHRKARAQILLDRQQCRKFSIGGESPCHRLSPGFIFKQVENSARSLNRPYVVTHLHHKGDQAAIFGLPGKGEREYSETPAYKTIFQCLPDDVVFRPVDSADKPARPNPSRYAHAGPQTREKPSVYGIQTATVTGKANEDIYTDEYGRVKIKFHWDLSDFTDEKTSCWVRVGQLSAGLNRGSQFIPRVGDEVIVQFENGDPDRPVIIGHLYNGKNKPPHELPGNKTVSAIRTRSTGGDNGYNEILFDDKKGEERLYVHAQKDMTQEVENDHNLTVKQGNQTITLEKGGRTVTLDKGDAVYTVKEGKLTQTVKKDMALTVESGGFTQKVKKNYALTVDGNLSIQAKSITLEADGNVVVKGRKVKLN